MPKKLLWLETGHHDQYYCVYEGEAGEIHLGVTLRSESSYRCGPLVSGIEEESVVRQVQESLPYIKAVVRLQLPQGFRHMRLYYESRWKRFPKALRERLQERMVLEAL